MATPRSEEGQLIATIPIALVATRAPCLVVGGGLVALRKVQWLLACGATVEAVAGDFIEEFATLDTRHLVCRLGTYLPGSDLGTYLLAIAATGDELVNQAVAEDASRAGIPVNVVDDPSRCTFLVPATVERGALRIAIATGGGAPVLSAQLREEFQEAFPSWYADYVAALGAVRERLRATGVGYEARAAIMRRLVAAERRSRLAGRQRAEMDSLLEQWAAEA